MSIGAGPPPLVKINNIFEIRVGSATFVIFKLIFEHSRPNPGILNSYILRSVMTASTLQAT